MSNDRLKLQEAPFSKAILTIFYKKMLSTQQIRHLWVASDVTIAFYPCVNETIILAINDHWLVCLQKY